MTSCTLLWKGCDHVPFRSSIFTCLCMHTCLWVQVAPGCSNGCACTHLWTAGRACPGRGLWPRPLQVQQTHARPQRLRGRKLQDSFGRKCVSTIQVIIIKFIETGYFCEQVGLARTVYMHCLWPCVWWFPCQRYRIYIGLARTIYIQCIYGVFGREITKYTVIYGV
jgi:hypothetical protein